MTKNKTFAKNITQFFFLWENNVFYIKILTYISDNTYNSKKTLHIIFYTLRYRQGIRLL